MEVLIVEDDADMQRYLHSAVANLQSVQQVHLASSASTALTLLDQYKITLLVCDLGLPDGDGTDIINKAAELNILSLVVSISCDEATVLKAVRSGANGYLLKDNSPPQIQEAIDELLEGGAPITPSVASHLLSRVRTSLDPGPNPSATITPGLLDLSERETEVLKLITRGYKVAEIARLLNLSPHTVGNHNRSIYKKLKVHSRSEAVYVAMQSGLVSKERR